METNKTIFLTLIFTIILLTVGNMFANYYFTNRAINLVTLVAPPLTISTREAQSLEKIIAINRAKGAKHE